MDSCITLPPPVPKPIKRGRDIGNTPMNVSFVSLYPSGSQPYIGRDPRVGAWMGRGTVEVCHKNISFIFHLLKKYSKCNIIFYNRKNHESYVLKLSLREKTAFP